MSKWTYFEAQQWAINQLADTGMDLQSPAFILSMIHDWTYTQLISHNREMMPDDEVVRYQKAVQQIANHVPPQYVVGKAPFFGRTFIVNQDVLIPESETEELIEWVLNYYGDDQPLNVLDLGTGSGVIGITLALERPNWQVTLSDISPAALRVAKANQRLHGTNLGQIESDLFAQIDDQFDLIVTNPPYIDHQEVGLMDQAVKEYIPPLALYADENGLGIYRRIFEEAGKCLKVGGQIFGETGFNQEVTIQALLNRIAPQANIETRHDINGNMRMIRVWDLLESQAK